MNIKPKNNLDYCQRYEKIFRRKILKKEMRDEIYKARKILFKDGLPVELKTPKQIKLFEYILSQILFNERCFLNLLKLCDDIMDKAELNKCYLYPLIIFLITGKVSKKCFKVAVAEIESEEMIKWALNKAKACDNIFLKRFLSGDFNFLFSNWHDFHPIYIKISPWADEKEITTFIIKNWQKIEEHQKLYGRRYLKDVPCSKLLVVMDEERKRGKSWKEIIALIQTIPELKEYKDLENWEYSKIYSKAKKRNLI